MATHVHVVLQGAKALLPSSTNHVRHYGLKHKISKQERHDLAEYGRKLTVLRKQFRQEWLEKVYIYIYILLYIIIYIYNYI